MFKPPSKRSFLFTRRAVMLGVGKSVLASTLVGRMYYLQVMQSKYYHTLSEENRIRLKFTAPERGKILDRLGRDLAINEQNFQLVINGEEAKPERETIQKLQKLIPITDEDIKQYFKQRRRVPRFYPVVLKDQLNWQQVSQFEVRVFDYPGVTIEEGLMREYPEKEKLCHYLGYVQPISDRDEIEKKYLRLPKFRIGRNGVEKQIDGRLRGEAGLTQSEVTAGHRVIRVVSEDSPKHGNDTKLALDLDLQRFTYDRLVKERSGSVVVLDLEDGGIRVMASYPAYDPNMFVDGVSHKYWNQLLKDKYNVLMNKSVSGQYAPGSTFKLVVDLAALESGMVSPYETVFCGGGVRLGSHLFKCWKAGGHGTVNMESAIAGSCNVYHYRMAERIGPKRIADMAHKLGLGYKTDLDFIAERSGIVPSEVWKRDKYDTPWLKGETYNTGIGQGYVLATPLQLAQMAARLGTGKMISPSLSPDISGSDFKSMDVKPENIRRIQEAMARVVVGPGGTAGRSRLPVEEFQMAGKTGTSQVARGTAKERAAGLVDEFARWKQQNHAIFVGYAPIQNPKYAIAVVIEHGVGGSKAAAPVAKDVLLELQQLERERQGLKRYDVK